VRRKTLASESNMEVAVAVVNMTNICGRLCSLSDAAFISKPLSVIRNTRKGDHHALHAAGLRSSGDDYS